MRLSRPGAAPALGGSAWACPRCLSRPLEPAGRLPDRRTALYGATIGTRSTVWDWAAKRLRSRRAHRQVRLGRQRRGNRRHHGGAAEPGDLGRRYRAGPSSGALDRRIGQAFRKGRNLIAGGNLKWHWVFHGSATPSCTRASTEALSNSYWRLLVGHVKDHVG
jgi:hypothetical protein